MGNLLHYAIVFLIVALVAAFLGFGGVAGTAMEGARLIFWWLSPCAASRSSRIFCVAPKHRNACGF